MVKYEIENEGEKNLNWMENEEGNIQKKVIVRNGNTRKKTFSIYETLKL